MIPLLLAQVFLGPDTQIDRPLYARIDSADEWRKLWREHRGRDEEPPGVDFGKSMVVAHARRLAVGAKLDKEVWVRDGLRVSFWASGHPGELGAWGAIFAVVPRAPQLVITFGYFVWGKG